MKNSEIASDIVPELTFNLRFAMTFASRSTWLSEFLQSALLSVTKASQSS